MKTFMKTCSGFHFIGVESSGGTICFKVIGKRENLFRSNIQEMKVLKLEL